MTETSAASVPVMEYDSKGQYWLEKVKAGIDRSVLLLDGLLLTIDVSHPPEAGFVIVFDSEEQPLILIVDGKLCVFPPCAFTTRLKLKVFGSARSVLYVKIEPTTETCAESVPVME